MKAAGHTWEFRPRFRKQAFGWKSQPAMKRISEAVAEIRRVSKKDAAMGAEGAVLFFERLSPALERIDSSSGAIGNAVERAIEALVPIIAQAEVESSVREAWLERLWEAIQDDDVPYIETLSDRWGELCSDPGIASRWADEFLWITKRIFSDSATLGEYFKGTSACLSALLFAGRYEEIIEVIGQSRRPILIDYRAYAARALAATGRIDEAIAQIEVARGQYDGDYRIARICEPMLLSAGLTERAFRDYGFEANRTTTFLGTFRALCKKYPMIEPRIILDHCIGLTPGEEGKWFAAARHAGFLDVAQHLASAYRTEPKTLIVAARDHAESDPAFAVEVGILALRGIDAGYMYDEPGAADVLAAYDAVMRAAEIAGLSAEARAKLHALCERQTGTSFVGTVLKGRREL